eukprot:Rhum_TRINITY_DN14829_c0_g1::Rhum_TRINITY_DN14829_c0_g1_i1::g.121860::m.121860/K06619/ABL1; abelson tyrosine-protein kinase 1
MEPGGRNALPAPDDADGAVPFLRPAESIEDDGGSNECEYETDEYYEEESEYDDDASDSAWGGDDSAVAAAAAAHGCLEKGLHGAVVLAGYFVAGRTRQPGGAADGDGDARPDGVLILRAAFGAFAARTCAGLLVSEGDAGQLSSLQPAHALLRPFSFLLTTLQISATMVTPQLGHLVSGAAVGWSASGVLTPLLLSGSAHASDHVQLRRRSNVSAAHVVQPLVPPPLAPHVDSLTSGPLLYYDLHGVPVVPPSDDASTFTDTGLNRTQRSANNVSQRSGGGAAVPAGSLRGPAVQGNASSRSFDRQSAGVAATAASTAAANTSLPALLAPSLDKEKQIDTWKTMVPLMVDTNGDGVRDSVVVDTTGDGVLDTCIPVRRMHNPSVPATPSLSTPTGENIEGVAPPQEDNPPLPAAMQRKQRQNSSAYLDPGAGPAKLPCSPLLRPGCPPPSTPPTPVRGGLGLPGQLPAASASQAPRSPGTNGTAGSPTDSGFGFRQRTIDFRELSFVRRIGAGHTSTVYLGRWRGAEVAVKEMLQSEEVLAEVATQKSISHPYILQCHGYATRGNMLYIVMEYCEDGCLHAYLRDRQRNGNPVTVEEVLTIAREVALAMMSVHADGCIHRDLAARNVFKYGEHYKLGDFGLVRDVGAHEGGVYKVAAQESADIPVNWTSPEALSDHEFTKAGDVWSFGVFLWEILTYCTHTPYGDKSLLKTENRVLSGEKLPRPAGCPEMLWDSLAARCFFPVAQRPTFAKISQEIIPAVVAAATRAPCALSSEDSAVGGSDCYKTLGGMIYGPSGTLCLTDLIPVKSSDDGNGGDGNGDGDGGCGAANDLLEKRANREEEDDDNDERRAGGSVLDTPVASNSSAGRLLRRDNSSDGADGPVLLGAPAARPVSSAGGGGGGGGGNFKKGRVDDMVPTPPAGSGKRRKPFKAAPQQPQQPQQPRRRRRQQQQQRPQPPQPTWADTVGALLGFFGVGRQQPVPMHVPSQQPQVRRRRSGVAQPQAPPSSSAAADASVQQMSSSFNALPVRRGSSPGEGAEALGWQTYPRVRGSFVAQGAVVQSHPAQRARPLVPEAAAAAARQAAAEQEMRMQSVDSLFQNGSVPQRRKSRQ